MKTLILALLFTPLMVSASLDGVWIGSGTWDYEGSSVPCLMKISFKEDETKLQRLSGNFDCNIVGLASDQQTWDKQNGQFLWAGQPAGHYTGTEWLTEEPYDDKVTVTTHVVRQDERLKYVETWRNDKGDLVYTVTGEFSKRR